MSQRVPPKRGPGWLSRLVHLAGNRLAPAAAGGPRLCIVNYHRILEAADPLLDAEPDAATFGWHMRVLAERFNVLPLAEAMAALEQDRLPPRAVCITFDDGYRSTHDLALPILQAYGLPATVFVSTGYVADGANMWNDRILEAVRALPPGELDLRGAGSSGERVYTVGTAHERKSTLDELTETAKYLPPQQREDLICRLEACTQADGSSLMLTPAMIVALAAQGVEIGAHTVSHPILTSLDDEAAMREIVDSKHYLEGVTGQPVRFFAYPNGKAGMDFDQRHVAMARAAGYTAAFTTATGAASKQHDRYALPRSRPWDGTELLYTLRLLRWLAR